MQKHVVERIFGLANVHLASNLSQIKTFFRVRAVLARNSFQLSCAGK